MNFFHLKRPYSRCRILVFRLRYRYRTAIGCPSPLRNNFNRCAATLTAPQVLSPPLRGFHRCKATFTASKTLSPPRSGFNRCAATLTVRSTFTEAQLLSPCRRHFHCNLWLLFSSLSEHLTTLTMKILFTNIEKSFLFLFPL